MKNILLIAVLLCSFVGTSQIFDGWVSYGKTTAEINAISSPSEGRFEYNSTTGTLWVYNGSAWVDLGVSGGGGSDDDITAVSFDGTNLTVTEGATSFSADISGVDTQLNQTQVGAFATAEGFIKTYAPTGSETAFDGWDKDASNDFDGTWASLTGIPADIADGDDTGGAGSDGNISNVALNTFSLDFTGSNGGFNGSVDLSSLQDGFEADTKNTQAETVANVNAEYPDLDTDDTDDVNISGTQTITGSKTFSNQTTMSNVFLNRIQFQEQTEPVTGNFPQIYYDSDTDTYNFREGNGGGFSDYVQFGFTNITADGNLVFTDSDITWNGTSLTSGGGATLTQEEVEDYVGGMVSATSDGLNYTDASGALTVDSSELNAAVIPNTPAGNLAATDIQGALNELQTEVDAFSISSNSDALTFTDEADGYTFLATDFDSGRKMFENFSATDEEYILDDVAAIGEKIVISQKGTGKIQVAEGTASLPLGEFQTKDNQTHLTLYKASDGNYYVIGDWDTYTATPAGNPNLLAANSATDPDNETNAIGAWTAQAATSVTSGATVATGGTGSFSVFVEQNATGATDGEREMSIQIDDLPVGTYVLNMVYNDQGVVDATGGTGQIRIQFIDPSNGLALTGDQTIRTADGVTQTINWTWTKTDANQDGLLRVRVSHGTNNYDGSAPNPSIEVIQASLILE